MKRKVKGGDTKRNKEEDTAENETAACQNAFKKKKLKKTHLERKRALLAGARVERQPRLGHLVQDLLLALGLLDEVGVRAARGDELLDVLDVVLLLEELFLLLCSCSVV